MTGIYFEELLGRKPFFLSDNINIHWNTSEVMQSLRNGNPHQAIFQDKKKDGESYWGKISVSPIKNFKGEITNYLAVQNKIVEKNYYDFGQARTPGATISAVLGDFIRNGDTRVKRIKQDNGTYWYYLTKNEENIGVEVLSGSTIINSSETTNSKVVKSEKQKTYDERDLHKLLSSYLKNTGLLRSIESR